MEKSLLLSIHSVTLRMGELYSLCVTEYVKGGWGGLKKSPNLCYVINEGLLPVPLNYHNQLRTTQRPRGNQRPSSEVDFLD